MTERKRAIVRVVDDDDAMRRSWHFLIEANGWPVRSYDSAQAFLDLDDPEIPGCVVLDVRMPGMSGIELQHELIRREYPIPIIFVSAHGQLDMAVQAIKDGAVDFLSKPVDVNKLLAAIEKAVSADLTRFQKEQEAHSLAEKFDLLTPREKMTARKLELGLPNKVIASELGISDKTVQAHRASVYRKLDIRSAAEITAILQKLEPQG